MKLLVDRLKAEPAHHDFSAAPQWWRDWSGASEGLAETLAEPCAVAVDAHRMGEDIYLEGSLAGALELECGRCLKRYRAPIRERFRVVLEHAGHRVPADPETAAALQRDGVCLSDELEAGWFQGSEIDLSALVHEIITLALPVQPVCREGCRGLCPGCGADRNQTTCGCVETSPASPFAVLEALRGGSQGDER